MIETAKDYYCVTYDGQLAMVSDSFIVDTNNI